MKGAGGGPATPVSVIVPVFNRESYVAECIESIRATGYPHLEILVVDDGSTDSTPAVREAYRRKARWCLAMLRRERDRVGMIALALSLLAADRSWLRDRGFVANVGRVLLHRSADLAPGEAGS